jgi:hypothetical protein
MVIDLETKKLSLLIKNQLPKFVQDFHPTFIDFLKVYYQFLESSGNAYETIAALPQYQNVDKTTDEVLERYFKSTYFADWPSSIGQSGINKRTFAKHITDIYRHKGDEQSFRALFRIMFNDEIELYYPKVDMIKLSESTWSKRKILRIGNVVTVAEATELVTSNSASQITGAFSSSTAVVDALELISDQTFTLTLSEPAIDLETETSTVPPNAITMEDGTGILISEETGVFRTGETVTQTNVSTSFAASGIVRAWSDTTKHLVIGTPTGPFNFAITSNGSNLSNVVGTDSDATWNIDHSSNLTSTSYELEIEKLAGAYTVGESLQATGLVSGEQVSETIKNIITSATILDAGDGYHVGEPLKFLGTGGGKSGTITVGDVRQKESELFTSDGATTTYTLLDQGDTATSTLIVNGVTQASASYKVLGKQLTLVSVKNSTGGANQPPASGQLIELRFNDGPVTKINVDDVGHDFPVVTGTFAADDYRLTLVLTSGGSGTYSAGETVLQQISTGGAGHGIGRYAKAVVTSWTAGTRTLVLEQVFQKFELINEEGSGNIIGQTSSASYTIDSITPTAIVTEASRTRDIELEIGTTEGNPNSFTLESGTSGAPGELIHEIESDDFYIDMGLYLSRGTGSGQLKRITDYVGGTSPAEAIITLDSMFTISPDATTEFSITPMVKTDGYYVINSTAGASTDAGDNIELESGTSGNTPNVLLREDDCVILLNCGSTGETLGSSLDDTGQLSEFNYIQDSYFYQDYSYQIKSGTSKNSWNTVVKNTLHPAGMEAFGAVLVVSAPSSTIPRELIAQGTSVTGSFVVLNEYTSRSIISTGPSGIGLDRMKHIITNKAHADYGTIIGFSGAGNGWNTYTGADEIIIEMNTGGSGAYTVGETVTQQDGTPSAAHSAAAGVVGAWDATNKLLTVNTITGINAFDRTRGSIGNIIGATSTASFGVANNISYNSVYNSQAGSQTTRLFAIPLSVDLTKTWQVSLTSGTNFTSEETVTGSSSGATGRVSLWDSASSPDRLTIENITGTFTTSDTVTGGTSSTAATLDTAVTS